MVNNPFLTVILSDFNVKWNLWYNKNTYEDFKIDGVTFQFGLQQMTKEPIHITHYIGDSSACNDLIFKTHPNLVMESGVHSSVHANCHYHITFVKFNLEIHYVLPYEREVWYYQKAIVD